jgi:hypothetical protein
MLQYCLHYVQGKGATTSVVVTDFDGGGFRKFFVPEEHQAPLAIDAKAPAIARTTHIELLDIQARQFPKHFDVFALVHLSSTIIFS